MRHRCVARAVLLALGLASAGCLLPAGGTPVYVDMRAGHFWSGQGRLLEVSDDQQQCRVAVRHRTLVVREMWVECAHVHALTSRSAASG